MDMGDLLLAATCIAFTVFGLCLGLGNGEYKQDEVQGCLDNYSDTLEELTKCFDLRLELKKEK